MDGSEFHNKVENQRQWYRHRFTLDVDFLREHYDLMEGAAAFFLDAAVEREDGMYTVSPSSSPENVYITPSGASGTLTNCAAMDGQILYALMSALEECGTVLGYDTTRWTAFTICSIVSLTISSTIVILTTYARISFIAESGGTTGDTS